MCGVHTCTVHDMAHAACTYMHAHDVHGNKRGVTWAVWTGAAHTATPPLRPGARRPPGQATQT
jgi:sugar phosphate isomerase/epimerase